MSLYRWTLVLLAFVGWASLSWADLPSPFPRPRPPHLERVPPKPPQPFQPQTALRILIGARGSQPTLYVPKQLLAVLKAEGPQQLPAKAQAEAPRGQTIAMGLSMTTAFTLGGLWWSRRNQLTRRTTWFLLLGCVLVSGSAATWGIASPPSFTTPPPPPAFQPAAVGPQVVLLPNGGHLPQVLVRPTDQNDLHLVLPPEMVPQLPQQPGFLMPPPGQPAPIITPVPVAPGAVPGSPPPR